VARTARGLTLIAPAAALLVAAGPAAPSPVTALAGRYSHHFRNGLVDGTVYFSDDVVEIVPVDASHAYVRAELQFYNGHMCSLAGVAAADGDALVYRAPVDEVSSGNAGPCTLTLRRTGARLGWDDGGSCSGYCGARGSFHGGSLPWSSKRPISYLRRLRASSEYRDALSEWRSGKSAD
jgi:hypothetical protein